VAAHYYSEHASAFRAELARAVPRETLQALHRRAPARPFLVAARQFALLGLAGAGIVAWRNPFGWIPLAAVLGFTVFNFTVLLHEVVHHTVFATRRPALERLLAWLYAVPSGISASQFTRWHLDHHAELGSSDRDPKRHHLSPKRNARWFKLLYCTPWLFPFYFRAAAREARQYPPALRRRIASERLVSTGVHLAVLGSLAWFGGASVAVRGYIIPVFFVFPIAFTLNRLGQHYDIDPSDPGRWTTLVKGHWFWDFAFLNSNYHLEHHYFPGVPFYHLPALQRALQPFFRDRGITPRTYGGLVCDWLIRNRAPHTNWHTTTDPGDTPAGADAAGRPAGLR
jgi:fatty acid desaturase